MNQSSQSLIDELGYIKAQIAELEDQKKHVEAKLKRRLFPSQAIEGDLFRGVRVVQQTKNVNWKAIAEHFNPSRQLITAHTSFGKDKDYIKVSARKGVEEKTA